MPKDQDQNDDRYRDAEKPKKNAPTHRYLLFQVKVKTTSSGFAFPLIRHSGNGDEPEPVRSNLSAVPGFIRS
ncbi:MAG TPA: hypothetical protein VGN21_04225, partial [Stellaceae bacterium]